MRLIKGFEDSDIYNRVIPYLCAYISADGVTPINVNTASAEVLQSLSADMTEEVANNIIEHRADTPFNDVKEFTGFANIKTLKNPENLSTSSNYFLLRTQAIIGHANNVMYSIIYRNAEGKTTIVSRTQRTL